MRLKKIPKGTKIINFTNPWPTECRVSLNKKAFVFVHANSFAIVEVSSFFNDIRLNEFPDMQLYSNLKIEMECF
jgi:hypothetical protein